MNFGEFTRWEPLKLKSGRYFIYDFTYSLAGLIIYLYKEDSEKSVKMIMHFRGCDVMTRVLNETYSSGQWKHLHINLRGKNAEGPLFKVEGSEYMEMLSNVSDGMVTIEEFGFKHYNISDSEWTIDVIAGWPPTIELFKHDELIEKYEYKQDV